MTVGSHAWQQVFVTSAKIKALVADHGVFKTQVAVAMHMPSAIAILLDANRGRPVQQM